MKLAVVFTITFTLCAAQLQINFGSILEGSTSIRSVNPIKHIFNVVFEAKSIILQPVYLGLIPYALYKNIGGDVKLEFDFGNEIYRQHHSTNNHGKVQAQAAKDVQYRCFGGGSRRRDSDFEDSPDNNRRRTGQGPQIRRTNTYPPRRPPQPENTEKSKRSKGRGRN